MRECLSCATAFLHFTVVAAALEQTPTGDREKGKENRAQAWIKRCKKDPLTLNVARRDVRRHSRVCYCFQMHPKFGCDPARDPLTQPWDAWEQQEGKGTETRRTDLGTEDEWSSTFLVSKHLSWESRLPLLES